MSKEIKLSSHMKFAHARYRKDGGDCSAEAFREDVLLPALKKNPTVTLDMTSDFGVPMSFSEELFGGIVRRGDLSAEELLTKLNVVSDDTFESDMIIRLIKRAES